MSNFPEELSAGYQRFLDIDFAIHQNKFLELGELGQSPIALVISCCDSRVTPESIFDAEPGDLFILRNVANIVPSFDEVDRDSSVSSAVEYAVNGLNIPNIIVLGHAMCGGVKAYCTHKNNLSEAGLTIGSWINHLKTAVESTNIEVDTNSDADLEEVEQASVRQSVENLATYPFVQSKLESEQVSLFGAWFDFREGELRIMDSETGEFDTVL